MKRLGLILVGFSLLASAAAAEISVRVAYLKQEVAQPPTLSNLDPVPEDQGEMGAVLGQQDNMTTGRFLGHSYDLKVVVVPVGGDFITAAKKVLAEAAFVVLDAPAAQQVQVADLPEAAGALLFNASSADIALRNDHCRANLFHTLPSYRMRSDALMQYAIAKRWTDLALISGAHPDDRAFADAMRKSAVKFGADITAEKAWNFDADMRRNAAQEVPLFTQELGEFDLLLVADEAQDFGRYIHYNTWLPRPVAGSESLVPAAWAPVVEQWGAAQLQSRFHELAGRSMRSVDYAAWAAMRTVGEAVTRTNSADPAVLRAFILSDAFELAGFKGRPLSYRRWNGQMRQPVPLVTARALVAQAPLDGFLHQHNDLDTLGVDAPESGCEAFQ